MSKHDTTARYRYISPDSFNGRTINGYSTRLKRNLREAIEIWSDVGQVWQHIKEYGITKEDLAGKLGYSSRYLRKAAKMYVVLDACETEDEREAILALWHELETITEVMNDAAARLGSPQSGSTNRQNPYEAWHLPRASGATLDRIVAKAKEDIVVAEVLVDQALGLLGDLTPDQVEQVITPELRARLMAVLGQEAEEELIRTAPTPQPPAPKMGLLEASQRLFPPRIDPQESSGEEEEEAEDIEAVEEEERVEEEFFGVALPGGQLPPLSGRPWKMVLRARSFPKPLETWKVADQVWWAAAARTEPFTSGQLGEGLKRETKWITRDLGDLPAWPTADKKAPYHWQPLTEEVHKRMTRVARLNEEAASEQSDAVQALKSSL